MARPRQPLNAKQELAIRMTARGCTRPEIMKAAFGIDLDTATEHEIRAADSRMVRLRKRPEFESIWKDEIRQVLISAAGSAYKVLKNQLNDEKQPWLANKAANDLLNHGRPQIYGAEENTVNVRIEGLPDIGSPDSEDV